MESSVHERPVVDPFTQGPASTFELRVDATFARGSKGPTGVENGVSSMCMIQGPFQVLGEGTEKLGLLDGGEHFSGRPTEQNDPSGHRRGEVGDQVGVWCSKLRPGHLDGGELT